MLKSLLNLFLGLLQSDLSFQVSVTMLYYSIVMVSIGSLSTGSPSVSSFSSGECMGQCHTTVL